MTRSCRQWLDSGKWLNWLKIPWNVWKCLENAGNRWKGYKFAGNCDIIDDGDDNDNEDNDNKNNVYDADDEESPKMVL